MKFTKEDTKAFNRRDIKVERVEAQLERFASGFSPLKVSRAAIVGDGILRLNEDRAVELSARWDNSVRVLELDVEKFVPASGAATRMFKEYFEYVQSGKLSSGVEKTLENIENFAFYNDLVELGVDFNDSKAVIAAIISKGLDYGQKPKGLLKFHNYSDGGRTACEEHLVEGALYGISANCMVNIHYTVSPEHLDGFQDLISAERAKYETRFGVEYRISYSQQKSSTDTIAVNLDNTPFRDDSAEILFRPSGHGALIENLSEINADVIFIKTVDNIVPDHRRADTVAFKKALAQLALDIQGELFGAIRAIENGTANLNEIVSYIEANLGYRFTEDTEITADELLRVLNRPLRVCGMVRNEGEPGGGPFWVVESSGGESVQIAESSQISEEDSHLMASSTHFNPVDLVCLTKDYKGEKFDLSDFVDPDTGFISQKSFQGRSLKALELPGLWNGAMANWNTLFVEVPITTFAPVKVLEDLLREQHQ